MRKSMLLRLLLKDLSRSFYPLLRSPVRQSTTMDHASVPTKPPNVLVLRGAKKDRESVREPDDPAFPSLKESLSAALDAERYVVYPLQLEEVCRAPWRDNCSLLVVSSELQLQTEDDDGHEILQELETFVLNGGNLLSTNAATNEAFGFTFLRDGISADPSGKLVHIIGATPEMRLDVWTVARTNNANSNVFPSALPTATNMTAKVLAQMREIDSCIGELNHSMEGGGETEGEREGGDEARHPVVDCIKHLLLERSPGHIILSHVDLFSSSLPHTDPGSGITTSVSQLVAVKRDAPKMAELLRNILIEIGIQCSSKETGSQLTLSYLICTDKLRSDFESTVASLVSGGVIEGSEVNIELITSDPVISGSSVDPPSTPTANRIVLLTNPLQTEVQDLEFDFNQYTRLLTTGHVGRTLLYTPVIGSTQTMLTGNLKFARSLSSELGVVCVAGQQTRGRGRHENAWLSPKGCMMFSLPLAIQPRSRLHSHLSLLQHIVALSVVSAIRTVPGYQDLPVCVKWPNDIYYQNKVKLGGILVNAFSAPTRTSPTTAIIGCGVNVCNKYPTMSINDCIHLHNTSHITSTQRSAEEGEEMVVLPEFTVEALLALTLNQLERYLSLYEHSGMTAIETDYYHYWLHSGSVVKLGSHENEEVTVKGIDEFGYLRVIRTSGEELTLRPDGNSFDIMRNLIVMK